MWHKKIKLYLKILPAILVMCLLFWQGILQGILESFGINPLFGETHFTFQNYIKVFISKTFIDSFSLTLKITFLSTFFAGITALVIFFFIYLLTDTFGTKLSDLFEKFFLAPMLLPYLIGGYMISNLLMQSGFLSTIFYSLGLTSGIKDFPILTNEVRGYSIIVTYVWKTTPFIILMIYPVFQRIQNKWKEVAEIFGANKIQFFIEIIFPLTAPSITISLFIIFTFIFSAFEVPYLLGVTYPKMLSVLSFDIYSNHFIKKRAYLMVINVIIIFVTVILGILLYYFNLKFIRKGKTKW